MSNNRTNNIDYNERRFVDLSDNRIEENRFVVLNMKTTKNTTKDTIINEQDDDKYVKEQETHGILMKRSKRGKMINEQLDVLPSRKDLGRNVSEDISSKNKFLSKQQNLYNKAEHKIGKHVTRGGY